MQPNLHHIHLTSEPPFGSTQQHYHKDTPGATTIAIRLTFEKDSAHDIVPLHRMDDTKSAELSSGNRLDVETSSQILEFCAVNNLNSVRALRPFEESSEKMRGPCFLRQVAQCVP